MAIPIPIGIATDNEDWLSTLYDSYTDILMAKGDFKSAAIYAKKAIASMVEADQKKASRQVRLLASILDVKNKELTISVREQELLIERAKVQKTRLWLFLTLLLLMGAMASVWWIRQRGRMKLQREQIASARKIIELDEREKSTVARDLHDLTGQMQVAFMGCFHNIKGKDDEVVGQAKMQIHEVGDRMRRLSHRLNSNMIGRSGITSMIREMCEDIEKMTNLKVSFVVDELASLADEAATLHLYRIIQEMLTNATKFIREGEITLHLLVEENRILLSYADPGPGFNPASQPEGMGLMNIYERVKLLQGEAILNSAIGQGTSWEISCPNRQNSSKI